MKIDTIDRVIITNAKPEDADFGAKLELMADTDFACQMLGCKNETEALEFLKKLWRLKKNRYSYEYSYIARINNKPAGLVICHPGYLCKKLLLPTLISFVKIGKLRYLCFALRHINRYFDAIRLKEAMDDEFLLHEIAVLPEYQGRGLGTKLLTFVKELALEEGFKKCSLLAAKDNPGNLRFYQKNGYKIVSDWDGYHEYYRMAAAI